MSVVRHATVIRGKEAPTLSNSMVNATIKGKINKESIEDNPDRLVITLQYIRMFKRGISKSNMSTDTNRTLLGPHLV